MRIQYILLAGALVLGIGVPMKAQDRCGHAQLVADRAQRFPGMVAARQAAEDRYSRFAAQADAGGGGGNERVIPVVVHLIQQSNVPAISDARVQSQIDVLNEDFGHMNADTSLIPPDFLGVAADCNIRFCLATIDPDGCPTTGINRVVAPHLAIHSSNEEAALKGYIQWDPYRYLNMWVPVNMDDGLLGYATFPDWLGWDPGSDGVVINGTCFGRDNGTPAGPYNRGRTCTHEVGHWLGLYHTFEWGCVGTTAANCLAQGDRVCDTPPTSASNFGCPSTQNTCTETPTDMVDQTMNFMDYTDDACMYMYTAGQGTRMDFYLNSDRAFIWSDSNLSLTGCDGTVSPGCLPVANLFAQFTSICIGQTVQFHDTSTGPPTAWNWTFQGGSPATSTAQDPLVSWITPGTYAVTLVVSNSIGTDTIVSSVQVFAGGTVPVVEDFEGGGTLPTGWQETSQSNQFHWESTALAASLGQRSMVAHNFAQTGPLVQQDLVSIPYDLSGAVAPYLTFDHAYKRKGGFNIDSLQVWVSDDCGENWQKVWERTGTGLATVPGFQANGPFIPTAAQWRTDTVDMTPFVGSSSVRLRFRSIGGNSQDIYVDNLNLSVLVGAATAQADVWSVRVMPNPATEPPLIQIQTVREGRVTAQLLDGLGRTVHAWEGRKVGRELATLEIPEAVWGMLPAGLYHLRLEGTPGSKTAKIVKVSAR